MQFSFNNPKATDEEIISYINNPNHITTISFVSTSTNIPYLCPVWGVYYEGKYYFQTDENTQKVRFLKKGNDKFGISIVDPKNYPDYKSGSIPYISFGGKTQIIKKDQYDFFEKLINLILSKYIENKDEVKKTQQEILEIRDQRIILATSFDWLKVARAP